MTMLRMAVGQVLVEDSETLRRPPWGPLRGCGVLPWTSPFSSQDWVFSHCHPPYRAWNRDARLGGGAGVRARAQDQVGVREGPR